MHDDSKVCSGQRIGVSGHIPLSHTLWKQSVKLGDVVIDATCGNGFDSEYLAQMTCTKSSGTLHCIDIQEVAVSNTSTKILRSLGHDIWKRVKFHVGSHVQFPKEILPQSVQLIVYNLGYLPKGDMEIVSQAQETVESLKNALPLLQRRGVLSVTCYRGHAGGMEESLAVDAYLASLEEEKWRTFAHFPVNRPLAPVLYTVYKVI